MSNLSHNGSPFDSIRRVDDQGNEFWFGRELMPLLEYIKWQRFEEVIERAKLSCEVAGANVIDHFTHLPGSVSGLGRFGDDYKLSRYACHLTAMNGDVRKEAIAQAQAYFSIKAHESELNPVQSAQPQLTPVQQTIADIDALTQWLTKTDAEKNLLEQAKYDTVANIHPEYRPLLEAAKKVRSTESIHTSVGLTATQVGEKLTPRLSAVKLNRILESMGLQYRDFSGRKPAWQLTEEGKEYGFVYFATNDDKWSGDQVRWQDSVIAEIQCWMDGLTA